MLLLRKNAIQEEYAILTRELESMFIRIFTRKMNNGSILYFGDMLSEDGIEYSICIPFYFPYRLLMERLCFTPMRVKFVSCMHNEEIRHTLLDIDIDQSVIVSYFHGE